MTVLLTRLFTLKYSSLRHQMRRSEPFAAIVYWSHNYTRYKYNVTVIRTWRTEDIMAIKKEKKAPQVTEIPEVSNYKEDLKEIKDLLKDIYIQLSKLDFRGGF